MALTGIDVSRHQGSINWPQVRSAGFTFAFIKATDGIAYSWVTWFHQNLPLVKAAGLIPGAYHFLLDHHPGDAQARFFVQEVNRAGGFNGVVPIVDIEREADGTTPGITQLRQFVGEFRRLVPGRPILIYTGRWYWVGVIGNPFGADLGPLWHSEYDGINPIEFDVANGPELEVYGGWTEATVWQHTSSGIVPGVAGLCDRNLFYGDLADLGVLAGVGAPPVDYLPLEDDMPWVLEDLTAGEKYFFSAEVGASRLNPSDAAAAQASVPTIQVPTPSTVAFYVTRADDQAEALVAQQATLNSINLALPVLAQQLGEMTALLTQIAVSVAGGVPPIDPTDPSFPPELHGTFKGNVVFVPAGELDDNGTVEPGDPPA